MNFKAQIETELKSQILACLSLEYAHGCLGNLDEAKALLDEKAEDNSEFPAIGKPGYQVKGNTAEIYITGLLVPKTCYDLSSFGITSYSGIAHYIDLANKDENVAQISLQVDSGGGFVKGLGGAIDQVLRSQKSISSTAMGTMASAAYWLSASTESITAKSDAVLGSIGVFATHYDQSKAAEMAGVEVEIFRSHEWKGRFNSLMPWTDKEKKAMQQSVDKLAEEFVSFVSDRREISEKRVNGLQGQTVSADEAIKLGLIDSLSEEKSSQTTTKQQAVSASQENDKNRDMASISNPEDHASNIAEARQEAAREVRAKVEALNALDLHPSLRAALMADTTFGVPLKDIEDLAAVTPF